MTKWTKLPNSERTAIGRYECDVWLVFGGARYTVIDTESGRYVHGGRCLDIDWAKQVSSNFARSLIDLQSNAQEA